MEHQDTAATPTKAQIVAELGKLMHDMPSDKYERLWNDAIEAAQGRVAMLFDDLEVKASLAKYAQSEPPKPGDA